MNTKKFLIAWIVTSVATFLINGVFHGLAAAGFFDQNLAGLGDVVLKMEDFNPVPVILLEFILVFVLTWILFKMNRAPITTGDAVLTGALFEMSTSVTWSLANTATFVSWPLALTVADTAWHTVVGAIAGWLIYRLGGLKKS